MKTPELYAKIIKLLSEDNNPFTMALQLFGNSNEIPKTNSLAFAVIEALEMHKGTLERSTIEECLDNNTKHVAFHILHEKNLTTVKKTIEIYELVKVNFIFVKYIKRLINIRDYKTAGQLAFELKLFEEFGLSDLLIPLFLEDRMVIFENYINHVSIERQTFALKFLDSLLTPPLTVLQKCEILMKKFFITETGKKAKFEEKSVNTMIERMAGKYHLDVKTVAPRHHMYKLSKKLGFAVRNHFEDKRSSVEAFQDQLDQLCVEGNVDLQVELLERLMGQMQFDKALDFARDYKVPSDRLPTDLTKYMEYGGGDVKKFKEWTAENDRVEIVPMPGAVIVKNQPDQQVPDNGWGNEYEAAKWEDCYELNLDPAFIVMVDTVQSYSNMLSELKSVTKVGFDTEHTTSNGVSILQIATRDKIYIVDILTLQQLEIDEISWAMMGDRLFNNKNVVKLGFDVKKDVEMLQKITKMRIETPGDEGYHDLKNLGMDVFKVVNFKYPHHEEGIKTLGLNKLAQLCFGKKLDKSNQLSNWSLRPLRPQQLTYAALDAFVLLEIHDVIVENLEKIGIAENDLKNNLFE